MEERGWEQLDFVYISGDAYVDHPSFGHAIITRLLEAHGFKVGIIAQPDWKDKNSITILGEPRLGFLVSAGNMDSMVNHYSVSKKHRRTDAYTPGGVMGKRPDYAAVVYSNLIRQVYKKTPIILGGIEASLRRLAHYDYWSDKLKRSILLDSGADLISYGMGEQSEVALHAVHADGNTSTLLNFENVKQESPEPGITLTTISLKDPLYPFQVKLFYKAYEESDLIEQWTIYQHTEKKPVTLYQFASAQLSFKSSSYRLTHFAGDWAGECNMSEVELTEGIKVIDSKLGTRATFFAHPMCLLSLNGRMTEDNGEVIGMALAWPANFKLEFEKNNNQELRVLAGMNPYASHYKLKKGDVFQTPSFLYTYSTKGNGQVSRNFHRWARKYGLRHGENSRYTLMNNWEATYFNFNEPKLEINYRRCCRDGLRTLPAGRRIVWTETSPQQ